MIRKDSVYVDSPRYDNRFNGGGECWKASGILEGTQPDKAPLLRIACHLQRSRPCFYHIAEDHRIVDPNSCVANTASLDRKEAPKRLAETGAKRTMPFSPSLTLEG